MKILMFSTHSMKYIWYSPQKSKYPLYIMVCLHVREIMLVDNLHTFSGESTSLKDITKARSSYQQFTTLVHLISKTTVRCSYDVPRSGGASLLDCRKTRRNVILYSQCDHASVVQISAEVRFAGFLQQHYTKIQGNFTVVARQSLCKVFARQSGCKL